MKTRLAIFASGSGSNALNLVKFFANHSSVEVAFVLSNRKGAGVVERCRAEGIEVIVVDNDFAENGSKMNELMKEQRVDFISLAGYLRKVPAELVNSFPNKMVNVHPAILPNYGGPGMYGIHVHKSVLANNEKQSGITIHFVNENYDEGNYIAQFYCDVDENDTTESLSAKVQRLEHEYLPVVIERTILNS